MSAVIAARARGEQALRASGARYAIVRSGWLTDGPPGGARLKQGDRGDGPVSYENVAEACVQALLDPAAHGHTFEIFDAQPEPSSAVIFDGMFDGTVDWHKLFGQLTADPKASRVQ